LAGEEVPCGRVAKEARDVDEDRVEEGGELVGVDLEVVLVVGEALAADLLHPLADPPAQRRALVAGEGEPPRAVRVFDEQLEPSELGLRRLARLAVALAHSPNRTSQPEIRTPAQTSSSPTGGRAGTTSGPGVTAPSLRRSTSLTSSALRSSSS